MNDALIEFMYRGALAALYLCGPVLATTLVVGILLAVLQAAMHLQDQVLPQVIKISLISFLLYVFGLALFQPLVELTHQSFAFAAFGF